MTDRPKINRKLFRQIHEVITTRPDLHDQSYYELRNGTPEVLPDCETTRCVAGWAFVLTHQVSLSTRRRGSRSAGKTTSAGI